MFTYEKCSHGACFCTICGELWRRVKMEFTVEWPMLKARWKLIVFGLIMQYVHGIFTQLAARRHIPLDAPLRDIGFEVTPELGPGHFWVSELIFGIMFGSFVIWTFSPFVLSSKRFYTAVLWSRLLMVLVSCQVLRIISFSVTQLPGSSFHCRAGEPTATRPWPKHWYQHIIVDVGRQTTKSCGDLIFSSHTTFVLTGVLAYTEYGQYMTVKVLAWLLSGVLSFLIICSRKHYTVDIVVAWYTVPLVFYFLQRRWTTKRPVTGVDIVIELDEVCREEAELREVLVDANNGRANAEVKSRAAGGKNYSEKMMVEMANPLIENAASSVEPDVDLGPSDTRPLKETIIHFMYPR